MNDILPRVRSDRRLRRIGLTAVGLFLFALIVVRVMLRPLGPDFVTEIIDGVVISVFISAFVATFLWWLSPQPDEKPSFRQLFPDQIGEVLHRAASQADAWEYVGHTGRDFRSRIIPILEKRAKTRGGNFPVRVVIIDPTDEAACRSYRDYRRSVRGADVAKDGWSIEKVQIESLATVINVVKSSAQCPQLNYSLGLTRAISVFRYDASHDLILVTQVDLQQPAYLYGKPERFYGAYRQECDLAWGQAHKCQLSDATSFDMTDRRRVEEAVKSVLGDRYIHVETLLDRAIAVASENAQPYA